MDDHALEVISAQHEWDTKLEDLLSGSKDLHAKAERVHACAQEALELAQADLEGLQRLLALVSGQANSTTARVRTLDQTQNHIQAALTRVNAILLRSRYVFSVHIWSTNIFVHLSPSPLLLPPVSHRPTVNPISSPRFRPGQVCRRYPAVYGSG